MGTCRDGNPHHEQRNTGKRSTSHQLQSPAGGLNKNHYSSAQSPALSSIKRVLAWTTPMALFG